MENKTYYDVLGVKHNCTQDDIKIAYRRIIQKYQAVFSDKTDAKMTEFMKLVNRAYDILKRPDRRAEYDERIKMSRKVKSTNHDAMRESYETFLQSQSQMNTPEAKKHAQEEFDKMKWEIDQRCGGQLNTKMMEDDMDKYLRDLGMAREMEDIENQQEKIFDNKTFNINEFNECFEKLTSGSNSVIEYTGEVAPYNASNVTILDENFAPSNKPAPKDTFLADVSGQKIDPIITHHKIKRKEEKITETDLDKLLQERELETRKIEDKSLRDYDTTTGINMYGTVEHNIDWKL